jgi:hypothetical protein
MPSIGIRPVGAGEFQGRSTLLDHDRPVLEHGPRSATCVRVLRLQTAAQSESDIDCLLLLAVPKRVVMRFGVGLLAWLGWCVVVGAAGGQWETTSRDPAGQPRSLSLFGGMRRLSLSTSVATRKTMSYACAG